VKPDAAELERRARETLSPEIYDYYAGGSGRERTLRASAAAWQGTWLAPRVLRDVSSVSTAVSLLGTELPTPVAVGPTAFQHLAHHDGELATAAGAARAGALYVLSTRSSRRIEDVAAVVADAGGHWWFQVYLLRDRSLTAGLVRRAAAAGAEALVLTGDTPVVGRRRRPADDGMISDDAYFANLGPRVPPEAAEQAPDLTLADIAYMAELGGGLPVVVKGVLRADDALACAGHGAAAVLVSNHGGRQLDGALPTARALPAVTEALRAASAREGSAVGTAAEVYVDGGLRTGEDVLAALALGARAAFLGRPVLWALASGGADGVAAFLDGLTDDLAHAMALAGAARVADLDGMAAPPA
jgi:4-hydroxymandelate oxidase